jgi:hypothetical protein
MFNYSFNFTGKIFTQFNDNKDLFFCKYLVKIDAKRVYCINKQFSGFYCLFFNIFHKKIKLIKNIHNIKSNSIDFIFSINNKPNNINYVERIQNISLLLSKSGFCYLTNSFAFGPYGDGNPDHIPWEHLSDDKYDGYKPASEIMEIVNSIIQETPNIQTRKKVFTYDNMPENDFFTKASAKYTNGDLHTSCVELWITSK